MPDEKIDLDGFQFSKIETIYIKLKPLNLKDDTRLFIKIYEMMLSCKESINKVDGWAKNVLTHEARKYLRELENMRLFNYAVNEALKYVEKQVKGT